LEDTNKKTKNEINEKTREKEFRKVEKTGMKLLEENTKSKLSSRSPKNNYSMSTFNILVPDTSCKTSSLTTTTSSSAFPLSAIPYPANMSLDSLVNQISVTSYTTRDATIFKTSVHNPFLLFS
jgi:hypothetical protein